MAAISLEDVRNETVDLVRDPSFSSSEGFLLSLLDRR
jgi:hypothetical protein